MTLRTINTVQELIQNLEMGTGIDGYLNLMKMINIGPKELEEYSNWNEERYTRNLIYKGDALEVLLMCWNPGNKSMIHSYDNQQGWVKVIDGELDVDFYMEKSTGDKMERYQTKTIEKGDILYVNDYLGFHAAANRTNNKILSLHIHANPVDKWKVYDPITNSFFVGKTYVDK